MCKCKFILFFNFAVQYIIEKLSVLDFFIQFNPTHFLFLNNNKIENCNCVTKNYLPQKIIYYVLIKTKIKLRVKKYQLNDFCRMYKKIFYLT